jgi:hypothetical protein
VSNSKNANTANYNSNILLTHKPNVILAWTPPELDNEHT